MSSFAKLAIAASLLCAASVTASAQSRSDKTFVQHAIEGNLSEVELGKMAQEKGSSQGIRSFGEMLVKDHSANNDKATQVAKDLNVDAPNAPAAKDQRTIDGFSKLIGHGFDRHFAQHMVDDHKKDIRDFQKASRSRDQEVADYAKQTLPTLQKHLRTAQSLTRGGATASR